MWSNTNYINLWVKRVCTSHFSPCQNSQQPASIFKPQSVKTKREKALSLYAIIRNTQMYSSPEYSGDLSDNPQQLLLLL